MFKCTAELVHAYAGRVFNCFSTMGLNHLVPDQGCRSEDKTFSMKFQKQSNSLTSTSSIKHYPVSKEFQARTIS